jgi:hypothetical protein
MAVRVAGADTPMLVRHNPNEVFLIFKPMPIRLHGPIGLFRIEMSLLPGIEIPPLRIFFIQIQFYSHARIEARMFLKLGITSTILC